uniref:Uncharacterized protein n=1 Tax=Amphimedon queenslandica TaxID=400682 RepID=A0A1X7T8D5_AMPQE
MPASSFALSLAVLILLLLVASNEGATGGGVCTEGFMDLSLLVAKAATPVGSLADNTLAEGNEGRWIISYNTSNCSTAAVTEVLLGVDIRSEYGNRNKYPSIDIWQLRQYQSGYYYQNPVTIPIVLSPDNITTNGEYRYVLPTPFSVSGSNYNTYRLGVYQPEDDSSVVRLYNATTSSTERVGRVRAGSIMGDQYIKITGSNIEIDLIETTDVFMVHLITNPPNCFQNVFTETEINTSSLSVTNVIPVNDTRAFPDIQFTCNGIITNWIIGITQNQDTSKHYPNIYLKRSSELIHALTVDASAATSSNGNVYNFTSDIEVEYGDILVINVTTNSNPMYYQQYNGPLNYELDSSNGLIPLEHNDYPLISVITKPIPSVTEFSSTIITMLPDHSTSLHYTTLLSSAITTTSLTNSSNIPYTTSYTTAASLSSTTNTLSSSAITATSLTSSSNIPYSTSVGSLSSSTNTLSRSVITTPLLTSVVTGTHIFTTSSKFLSLSTTTTSPPSSITDSSVIRSTEPTAPSNTGDGNSALIIAAVVATVLVLLIVSVMVILILITIAYKRRSKATLTFRGRRALLVNSVYSDVTPNGRDLRNMSNPNYQVLYEEPIPVMDGIEAVYSDTSAMTNVGNPMYGQKGTVPSGYEEPVDVIMKQKNASVFNELYGLLEEAALYVPNASERSGGQSEEIYSTLINEQV